MNFIGDSVVAADDLVNTKTSVTINHKADAVHTVDQPAQAHAIDSAKHTASGLTAGHVLRATAPTTFAFGSLQDGDIPASIARDTEVSAAITTHEAAADPHAQYQKESEKGAASGYASLDASTKVPLAQLQEVLGLTDLSDVTITAPSTGQVLKYNGTSWVNDTDATGGGAGANTSYTPGSVTVATGNFALQAKRLQLTGSQRLTVAGTGRYTVMN